MFYSHGLMIQLCTTFIYVKNRGILLKRQYETTEVTHIARKYAYCNLPYNFIMLLQIVLSCLSFHAMIAKRKNMTS